MTDQAKIIFEETVREYEALYADGYGERATPTQKLAINSHQYMKKRGVTSILDVGCGRGKLLHSWEERGYRVAGTEIVPGLLARELGYFDEIYPYSVSELGKIADQSFDIVSFVDVLDHLKEKQELADALSNAQRIAVKGVLITVNSIPRSPQQVFYWPEPQWAELVGRFYPNGLLDVVERNGLRFIAWKERKYAVAGNDARDPAKVPGAPKGAGGEDAEGAEGDDAGVAQRGEEAAR